MTNAFITLSLMATILFVIAFRKNKHRQSITTARKMLINILPLLLLAFTIVGFIEVLVPKEALQNWLGAESGWRGLVIGPLIGAVVQGGPFAFFPMFDSIFRDSVTTGTAVAMISAWGMINIGHLPYEFAFLGYRFVILKYSIYIFLPSLAGLIANLIFGS